MTFLWVPVACIAAHLFEEFVWPGGFAEWYRHYPPGYTTRVSTRFLVIVNVAFVGLALLPPQLGPSPRSYAIWITVAGVAAANAVFHITAVVRTRTYSPGVVTGVLLYLPLLIIGGAYLTRRDLVSTGTLIEAIVIGIAYHVWSAWNHRRHSSPSTILGACLASFVVSQNATAQTPRVELDHIYIVVQPAGAKEIAALQSAGLRIGRPQKHDGEGTTSVAAMFDNAYLELMWLDSTLSITAEHAASAEQFRQAAAWRVSRHSPFGIGLRRLPGETAEFAFPIKRESAPWIDSLAAYEILNQPVDSLAVDLFVVPRAAAVPSWIDRLRKRSPETLEHPGGGRRITAVRLHGTPQQQPSSIGRLSPAPIETRTAAEPLVEIYIDGGARNSRTDLRPALPVVIIR